MKVIIIGCGRMGSGLAISLIQKGDSVTVIDINPEAFDALGKSFKGITIEGVGFDRDILMEAKISLSDAVVACTKNDETNALIGLISKNIYKVPCVISRLYEPRKAEIYRRFGIQTISTTTWGIQRATDLLSYNQLDNVFTFGNSDVELVRIETPALLVGRTIQELTVIGEFHVVAINRDNKSFLPAGGTTMQKNDIIFIALFAGSTTRLKTLLGLN